jgi:predicted type IV restriction endonuclease
MAFVVRSALIRAVISAIGWFKQANPENVHSTHASYEDARDWLVTHAGHPAHVFDALERQVRSRVHKTLDHAS